MSRSLASGTGKLVAVERDATEGARELLRFAESVFPGDINVEQIRGLLKARVATATGVLALEKTSRGTSAS